jgi:predicted DNA binding CopG/RHH family protein
MESVSDWNKIPDFEEEEDEAKFWLEHELDGRLMAGSVHQPDSRESTTITLRFDPRMLSRIKRIARTRFLNYQSMMKQWLAERLEDEIRKQ